MSMNIKDINNKEQDEQLRKSFVLINAIKNRTGNTLCSNGVTILSEENFKYLVDNYNKVPLEVISKKIKRKPNTIRNIAKRLRLTSCYLNEGEYVLLNLLAKLGSSITDSYLVKILFHYGLPARKDGFWYVISLTDFYEWFDAHRTLISLHNYVVGTLPNEPEWFIEKTNADKRAIVYTFKRKWTDDEDNLLKRLVNERKTYAEISSILKRTGNSIKRRCYDLNIGKPRRTPPKAWTTTQVEVMRNLWLKGYQICIIAEEINRSDREIQSYLERKDIKYFGKPPLKF